MSGEWADELCIVYRFGPYHFPGITALSTDRGVDEEAGAPQDGDSANRSEDRTEIEQVVTVSWSFTCVNRLIWIIVL
jgi:hypothetical protein